MLVEFSVVPVGTGTHLGAQIAEVVALVDASGLAYEVTACGTCVEGEWAEVMELLGRCRDRVRQSAERAVWIIKIDDVRNARDMLMRHVLSIEERLGRGLRKPRG